LVTGGGKSLAERLSFQPPSQPTRAQVGTVSPGIQFKIERAMPENMDRAVFGHEPIAENLVLEGRSLGIRIARGV
jgi:hypothetical protein